MSKQKKLELIGNSVHKIFETLDYDYASIFKLFLCHIANEIKEDNIKLFLLENGITIENYEMLKTLINRTHNVLLDA